MQHHMTTVLKVQLTWHGAVWAGPQKFGNPCFEACLVLLGSPRTRAPYLPASEVPQRHLPDVPEGFTVGAQAAGAHVLIMLRGRRLPSCASSCRSPCCTPSSQPIVHVPASPTMEPLSAPQHPSSHLAKLLATLGCKVRRAALSRFFAPELPRRCDVEA